jgi:hypothetical protein
VRLFAAPRDLDLGIALAERADRPAEWLGLGRRAAGELALLVVRGAAGFDSAAGGRLPSWGAGLALPRSRIVVVRADAGDPFQILRHELAHVVLHSAIRGRVPLWFDEGYATVAAGEFGRLEALQLNLGVALGRVPSLAQLDAGLRAGQETAQAAYALAATAVLYVARRHPGQSLSPLLERLGRGLPFDSALVLTTGLSADRLDEAWQRDVKRRHGIGLWLVAGGMWSLTGALVILAVRLRRRRDAARRAQLDVGWTIPLDEEGATSFQGETSGGSTA